MELTDLGIRLLNGPVPVLLLVIQFLGSGYVANAGLSGGCAALDAEWRSAWVGTGGYCYLRQVQPYVWIMGSAYNPKPDPTGRWDVITEYQTELAELQNLPGAPWYSPRDTNVSFKFQGTLVVKRRMIPQPPGRPAAEELEFSMHSERLLLFGTFEGAPTLTWIIPTPDSLGYIESSGPLTNGAICIARSAEEQLQRTNPPVGLVIGRNPDGIGLFWKGTSGCLYLVQSTHKLQPPEWTDVGSPSFGNDIGSSAVPTRGVPLATNAFYRLLEFP